MVYFTYFVDNITFRRTVPPARPLPPTPQSNVSLRGGVLPHRQSDPSARHGRPISHGQVSRIRRPTGRMPLVPERRKFNVQVPAGRMAGKSQAREWPRDTVEFVELGKQSGRRRPAKRQPPLHVNLASRDGEGQQPAIGKLAHQQHGGVHSARLHNWR